MRMNLLNNEKKAYNQRYVQYDTSLESSSKTKIIKYLFKAIKLLLKEKE